LADRKKVPAAFYRTEMGMEPVREWLRSLPPRTGAGAQAEKRHRKGEAAAMSNKYIGSSVDDFLKEDGIYEETLGVAIKRVIAWQIQQAMKQKRISKRGMAERMKTSRSQVDRLLDPDNMSVQLNTLQRAAGIVGQRLVIGLEPVA
jgi:antitoxin HicB